MNWQLFVLVAVQVTVAVCVTGEIVLNKTPNLKCSGVEKITMSNLLKDSKSACKRIIEIAGTTIDPRNLERFDLVQECTCNIVDQSVIWQSLMTYELQVLYEAVQALVQDRILTHRSSSEPLIRYFASRGYVEETVLDSLNEIYRTEQGLLMMNSDLLKMYQKRFNPTIGQAKISVNDAYTKVLSNHCDNLKGGFSQLKAILEQVGIVAKNIRFINEAATYDYNLFKVLVVDRACDILKAFNAMTSNKY